MYADLDYNHPEVTDDVKNWAVWLGKQLNLKGIRFDAVKHASSTCVVRGLSSNKLVLRGLPERISTNARHELWDRLVFSRRSRSSHIVTVAT